MANNSDLLFSGPLLSDVLQANLDKAKQAVDAIPQDQFSYSSDEEVIGHVYSMCEVTPLVFHEDLKTMGTQEVQVDVRYDFGRDIRDTSRPFLIPGFRVSVAVPFEGDADLWKCRPSEFSFTSPCAHVKPARDVISGVIEIVRESPIDNVGKGEAIKREVDSTIAEIKVYIGRIRKDVEKHNTQLCSHIQQCVEYRRHRLNRHAEIVKTLDIPLRRSKGAPEINPLPINRRLIRPLPSVPNSPPNPGIREEDYAHILSVIRQAGRTFEVTPKTFAIHDEEELRDIILANLNTHYEGDATGETFRNKGKTDIRIETDNRAAFIGECKVWRGDKQILEAVDQLLGYLTWRDCKAALIIFNKDVAGFSSLQVKLPETLKSHTKFFRAVQINEAGEWRFIFRSLEDEDRHITIHVFLFNLFISGKSKAVIPGDGVKDQ